MIDRRRNRAWDESNHGSSATGQTNSKKRKEAKWLSTVNPNTAGIDFGFPLYAVAVPGDCDNEPARTLHSFMGDLRRLADWLVACRIDTMAIIAGLRAKKLWRLRHRCYHSPGYARFWSRLHT